ncbi:unnamed protein product [Zymoseptoria tritici ST99CH_3D1]|nr:unnamed protein product [Zymoseptoria tritici ST99CH_3D1]
MPGPSVPGAQLGQFLVAINGFIQNHNEDQLAQWMIIEPPFPNEYQQLISEVRQLYPKGNESALEDKCRQVLSAARDGVDGSGTWSQFILFMVQYLVYLRDLQPDKDHLLETFESLSLLQKKANSALNHGVLGQLMLSVVVTSAKFVCFLAITLDKDPSLLGSGAKAAAKEDDSPVSLAEGAVNNLRDAFNTCATDRTSYLDSNGRPEGKKRGIYLIANICFKILFQCRKTSNATTFFEHIYLHSPPLSAYPKSQRVTYLYYLGAYLFENSHFYRAQLALQHAYDESPASPQCIRQRRRILVYLITSNIIMGRFPSASLLQRPEAQGLYDRFMPLMHAIRSGNIAAFRQHLDWSSPHADFFLHFRILLQLRNRCEVLVWRSLIRKTWILAGTRYDRTGNSKAAPHVSVEDLVAVFYALEKRAQNPAEAVWQDPDFDGADYKTEPDKLLPDATSIESILSSLIEQGFLRGFLAHRSGKFVIMGAKQRGGDELAAGFPTPWEVIRQKADEEVPGWRKMPQSGAGGMVINLSGARPAGMV